MEFTYLEQGLQKYKCTVFAGFYERVVCSSQNV